MHRLPWETLTNAEESICAVRGSGKGHVPRYSLVNIQAAFQIPMVARSRNGYELARQVNVDVQAAAFTSAANDGGAELRTQGILTRQ